MRKAVIAGIQNKVILLDDDESFLEAITLYLKSKLTGNFKIKHYSKSAELMKFIEDECYIPDSPATIIADFYSKNITINTIETTLHELTKVKSITVIDQNLRDEELKGIDIISKLRDYYPSLKIIFLTSVICPDTAIDLHNSNIIDVFINKEKVNAVDILESTISQQISNITDECQYDIEDAFPGALQDKEYVSIKRETIDITNYKSYLTINQNGDIALLDDNNHIQVLKYDPIQKKFNSHAFK